MKHLLEWIKSLINPPDDYIWTYEEYYFTRKELILNEAISLLLIWLIAYCFYDSIIACLIMSPLSLVLLKSKRAEKKSKRLSTLGVQFKDGINFLSGAVNAGYSVENGWKEAKKQLVELYGEEADITREFTYISRKCDMNVPIGDLITDLADRTGNEDIRTFSESFAVAKKSGGSMKSIIAATSDTIAQKVEVSKEIETMVAGKKMEQKIMTVVPLGIIFFVRFSSPSFLNVLYGNLLGVIIMTICLAAYYLSVRLGERILDIKV